MRSHLQRRQRSHRPSPSPIRQNILNSSNFGYSNDLKWGLLVASQRLFTKDDDCLHWASYGRFNCIAPRSWCFRKSVSWLQQKAPVQHIMEIIDVWSSWVNRALRQLHCIVHWQLSVIFSRPIRLHSRRRRYQPTSFQTLSMISSKTVWRRILRKGPTKGSYTNRYDEVSRQYNQRQRREISGHSGPQRWCCVN